MSLSCDNNLLHGPGNGRQNILIHLCLFYFLTNSSEGLRIKILKQFIYLHKLRLILQRTEVVIKNTEGLVITWLRLDIFPSQPGRQGKKKYLIPSILYIDSFWIVIKLWSKYIQYRNRWLFEDSRENTSINEVSTKREISQLKLYLCTFNLNLRHCDIAKRSIMGGGELWYHNLPIIIYYKALTYKI